MNGGRTIARILVAVDASPLSVAALEAGAELAERRQAELAAVFVEDVNLLRLAAHPQALSFSLVSGRPQPLDLSFVERALRLQAAAARRAHAEAMARRRLASSFSVRRGTVAAELVQAAGEADILIIGCSGRVGDASGAPSRRLGSIARTLMRQPPAPLLVVRGVLAPGGPVGVVFDASPDGRRALALAAELAERDGGALEVFVAGDAAEAARAEAETAAASAARRLSARLHLFAGPEALASLAGRHPVSLMVAGQGSLAKVERLPVSLLLVP